ncbi:hypothetical protein BKA62DRAFT_753724 [Auriculariales sp. MPI-PUGE-AT-0066]|nr:hypothetical protein BKA62DRAFT_753724 [Auriculariales sp. MPI-PUGE-AT-0066]
MLPQPRMSFTRRQRNTSSPQDAIKLLPFDISTFPIPQPPPMPSPLLDLPAGDGQSSGKTVKPKRSFFSFKSSKSSKPTQSADKSAPSPTEEHPPSDGFRLPIPDFAGSISLGRSAIALDERLSPNTSQATIRGNGSRPMPLQRAHSDIPNSFSASHGHSRNLHVNASDAALGTSDSLPSLLYRSEGSTVTKRYARPGLASSSCSYDSHTEYRQLEHVPFPPSLDISPRRPPLLLEASPADTLHAFIRMDFPMPPPPRTRTDLHSSHPSPPVSPTSLLSTSSTACSSGDTHFGSMFGASDFRRAGSDSQSSPGLTSSMSSSLIEGYEASSPFKSSMQLSRSKTEQDLSLTDALKDFKTARLAPRHTHAGFKTDYDAIPAGRKIMGDRSGRGDDLVPPVIPIATPPRPPRSTSRSLKTLPILPPPTAPLPMTPAEAIKALEYERSANDQLRAQVTALTAERDVLLQRVDDSYHIYRGPTPKPNHPVSHHSGEDNELFDMILANFNGEVGSPVSISTPELESDEELVYKPTPPLRVSGNRSKPTRSSTADDVSAFERGNTIASLYPPNAGYHTRAKSNPEGSPRLQTPITMVHSGALNGTTAPLCPGTGTTPSSPPSQIPTLRNLKNRAVLRHGPSKSVSSLPTVSPLLRNSKHGYTGSISGLEDGIPRSGGARHLASIGAGWGDSSSGASHPHFDLAGLKVEKSAARSAAAAAKHHNAQ